ncbi:hypothetical protein ACFVVU_35830 [Kitasatospora sp. NPDC057965]|uniref:hypothetical protein n=1 Tax=Kitasatospora sp. NPDC057965 TaxID=3346291 RepID=UPI0036DB5AB4
MTTAERRWGTPRAAGFPTPQSCRHARHGYIEVTPHADQPPGSPLLIGAFLRRPSSLPLLPYTVGLATALIIASLGPRSGGSANPAPQFWHTLTAPARRARTRHAPGTDSG